MIQLFGYTFLSLIFASLAIAGDYHLSGSFLDNFLNSGFVETFAALVGFNIAAVTFLMGNLGETERAFKGASDFSNTRKEIKQNIYFLFSVFVLALVALIIRPNLQVPIDFLNNEGYYLLNGAILTFFGLGLASIFEVIKAIFSIAEIKLK